MGLYVIREGFRILWGKFLRKQMGNIPLYLEFIITNDVLIRKTKEPAVF